MGFLKKRGGFLHDVNARIMDYRWTDEAPSKDGPVPFKPGKVKGDDGKVKDRFHSLYLELQVRADGAKENISQSLFAGGFDDYEVSDDGKTLSTLDGSPLSIGESTAAGTLLASMFEAGLTYADIGYEDEASSIDLSGIIGRRVQFIQRRDEETTKRRGKRLDKKTGREYDYTNLVVEQVYPADTAPVAAVKVAPKATSKANGKANGKAPEVDIDALTEAALTDYINSKGGSITKVEVSSYLLRQFMKDPNRNAMRAKGLSDEFLAATFNYDQAAGTIGLRE